MPKRLPAFSDEQIAQIEKLAGNGLTQEQIADFFGLAGRTLRRRLLSDQHLVSAYKRGRAQAIELVSGKLMALINDGNAAATFFWLKTQAGWREADAKQAPPSEISKLSDRELEKEKKRLGIVR